MNSIVNIIHDIEKQPGLYLTGNSINLLNSFLCGFIMRDPETITDIHLMSQFQQWIEIKYDKAGFNSWVKIILFYSHDEFDALDNFFKNFNSFLSEKSTNNFNIANFQG